MNEIALKGRKTGRNCSQVWLAAFTLAALTNLASCKNETVDESIPEPQPPAPQRINENGEKSKTTGTPIAKTPQNKKATVFSIPDQEQHSVESAEEGYIMLAGGEIVTPEYLSECTQTGLEPIGLLCYREEARKFLIGMDAFYSPERFYGWGKLKKSSERLQFVQVIFSLYQDNLKKLYLKRDGTKQYSDGNNAYICELITRGTEQSNVFLDYIASYGPTHDCARQELKWEAPTVYESYSIYLHKAELMKGIHAVTRYFKNVDDIRGRLLESSGGLISGKKYVLTSSSNEKFSGQADCNGIWAFKELDREGGTPNGNEFHDLLDANKKSTRSYQFKAQDLSTGSTYHVEYVLVKANSDGFAAMAVAALN